MNPDAGLHADEIEQGLLGSVVIDPTGFVLDAFLSVPTAAYWGERNRVIAARIRTMLDTGRDVDLVNLTDELRLAGELERVGSIAYLIGMCESVPTTEHAPGYATTLNDLAARRDLARFAGEALVLARDRTKPLEEVYGAVELGLTKATREVGGGSSLDAYAAEAERMLEDEDGSVYLSTGLSTFDRLTGGLRGLVIVGARPSMGKSSFARDVLRHQRGLGRKVALFTQDQAASEVFAFEASIRARVPFHALKTKQARPHQVEAWRHASRQLRDEWRDSYLIDDRPHNLHALASRIRAAARWGAELIAVDYLQLIDVPGVKDANMVHTVTTISKALKHLTQELNVPILALAQLSRAVEQRQDKRPMLSDLRESGQIEQDANMTVLLYRPEYYRARAEGREEELESEADLIVAKNKTGPVGTARVLFNGLYATFRARGTAPII